MNDIFTVSQINKYLKNKIESDLLLTDILLKCEISNFKAHFSGHLYMTLKDEASTLRAVMFKGDAVRLKIRPEDGMKVIVRCRIGVYEAGGSYQAYIREMQSDGLGDLHVAFEQLKAKLEEEGLFDEAHKKGIPKFPEKIGVITSATGAAVQDIKNVLERRYPIGEIIIYPSLVQGEDAPPEIVSGIEYFNTVCPVDVLIVGRGGGSIEDLWAFNDERVARAVYASEVPVISAVGHETDFTICDFVADLRAPTPSAAAELAATPVTEIKAEFANLRSRLSKAMSGLLEKNRLIISSLGAEKTLERLKNNIDNKRMEVSVLSAKMLSSAKIKTERSRGDLSLLCARLDGASPLKIMQKGYVAVSIGGVPAASVNALSVGDRAKLKFADGTAEAEITDICPENIG